MKFITIDFETKGIEPRPKYPPQPVGVAIKWPGQRAKYYAWGHPLGNNCTLSAATQALKDVWASALPVLMHNAKFDLDVAEVHFKLPRLPWERILDSMILAFLKDPHSSTISLKPLGVRYLGMPPDEQDAVKEWLVKHKVIATNQGAGAFISECDGRVVARYAKGDVDRTAKLHDLLYPQICEAGMLEAYERELRLLPILLDNEREGIRVDLPRLERDLFEYETAMVNVEGWLRAKLNAPDLNLDAAVDVADALEAAGLVTDWVLTKTKKRSVAKKNIRINDPEFANMRGYRERLKTCLSQSMRPWCEMAKANNGRIFTEWNQVRTSRGNEESGTRSGRLSCSRFQNITKRFDGFTHPTVIALPQLPLVRKYIVPEEGHVICHRDYNQQEFRILGHFEADEVMESYLKDPRTDYHAMMAQKIMAKLGISITRLQAKTLNFGILYGMGAGKLAATLGMSVEDATGLLRALKSASPGIKALDEDLKKMGRHGEAIYTWGGRRYFCEEEKMIKEGKRKGQMQTFEYKLLNYLIQGSAADCTKEAIIRLFENRVVPWRFMLTVHDEINLSAPAGQAAAALEEMRVAMESIEFNVPMLSDAKTGANWGALKEAA